MNIKLIVPGPKVITIDFLQAVADETRRLQAETGQNVTTCATEALDNIASQMSALEGVEALNTYGWEEGIIEKAVNTLESKKEV